MKKLFILTAISSMSLFAACDKGSTTPATNNNSGSNNNNNSNNTGGNNNGGGGTTNPVSYTISANMGATAVSGNTNKGTISTVGAYKVAVLNGSVKYKSTDYSISISIGDYAGAKTYDNSGLANASIGFSEIKTNGIAYSSMNTNTFRNKAVIIVTKQDATMITGTFTGTVYNANNIADSIVVTDGKFTAKL
ncbi:MAG TPA: DUF5025 domain-containing protein [Flavipsychrobacter sp.]